MVSPAMIATHPSGASDVVIEGCRFLGSVTVAFGVLVTAGSRDVFISDSFFGDMQTGVRVTSGLGSVEGVVVESCRFNGSSDVTEAHIEVAGGPLKSLRVAQCEFRADLTAGVSFAAVKLGGGPKTGVTIEGCVFRGVNGITGSNAHLMTVTGNTFDPEGLSPDYAVSLIGSFDVSVTGNVLPSPQQSYTDGLVFDGQTGLSVAGNQVSGCNAGGIRVTGSLQVEIVGNTVFSCGGNGIEVDDSEHVTIEANVTRANGGHGIAVGPTALVTNAVVGGNVSSGNGMDGLNLNATNLAVNCNVCCGNVGTDINFVGGSAQTNVGNVRTSFLNEPVASAANALCFVPP